MFSLCGRLAGHLPVCGWLRVATSFIKRRVNAVTTSWDEEIADPKIHVIHVRTETLQRAKSSDPA